MFMNKNALVGLSARAPKVKDVAHAFEWGKLLKRVKLKGNGQMD